MPANVGIEMDTRDFDNRVGRWSTAVEEAAVRSLQESAEHVRGKMVKAIQTGPRSGATYKSARARAQHKASAPGEFPKTDTGELAASFYVWVDRGSLTAIVGNAAPHAAPLEYKPANRGGRPFMGPIFEDQMFLIVKRFRAAYKRATRDAAGEL